MFFVASKVLWFVTAPSNVILLMLAAGAALSFGRRKGLARALVVTAAIAYVLCGIAPLGVWLARPLEDRFPRPPDTMTPPDGIIVLGGAIDPKMLRSRHALVLAEGASRMTDAVALALRFPAARVVFTGGSASLTPSGVTEAQAARGFFEAMGLPPGRVVYEDRSRNTFENAIFTRDLVHPTSDQHWLLVTSAFHMPRAMGIFRKAGFDVTAWPADYMTTGRPNEWVRPIGIASNGLRLVDIATHEWIGLAAYRATGKTDALFPAPAP